MDTLKLFVPRSHPATPVSYDPDPHALARSEYLCVGSVPVPPDCTTLLEAGCTVVRLDDPASARHGVIIDEGELLERGGFYEDFELGDATLEALQVRVNGQEQKLRGYLQTPPMSAVELTLQMDTVRLSRMTTTLQELLDTAVRSDYKSDLEDALELLRTVGEAVSPLSEAEPAPFS